MSGPLRRVPRRLTVYTDGAARGNPGPAGAGVRIEDADGAVVAEISRYLGHATNNVAEYHALLLGLEQAQVLGAQQVDVRMDSELIVRQMNGAYRVRNAGLRPLYERACGLARNFSRVEFAHVRREENREADRLANVAIDEGDSSDESVIRSESV